MITHLIRFFVLAIFLLNHAYAQVAGYSTENKQAIISFNKSSLLVDAKDYEKAIFELNKAISLDSNFAEAQQRIGDVYRQIGLFPKAAFHYQKVILLNPEYVKSAHFNLGLSQIEMLDYANAEVNFRKYLTFSEISESRKKEAEQYILDAVFSIKAMKNPVPFKPIILPKEINTELPEYLPAITADDSTLIFTRKNLKGEDFYFSEKTKTGWQTSKPLSTNINTPMYNEGAQTISSDGQLLIFTVCNRFDSKGSCDLYFSKLIGSDWAVPQSMGTTINTSAWESQPSLSADGRTLYFASNRPGGFGKIDIYKSELQENSTWGIPQNLGKNINTPMDEESPFIHADGRTLYFSSDGWPGLGSVDLFFSRLDAEMNFSIPTNLGYPINTNREESSLIISTSGIKAYFASNKMNKNSNFDLYEFDLYKDARPEAVTFLRGIVMDEKSLEKLNAEVEVVDLNTNKAIYSSYSNPKTGIFLTALPSMREYALNISKNGYLLYSENFLLNTNKEMQSYNREIFLKKIEAGEVMELRNIFYDLNSYDLLPKSKVELNKLLLFLNANKSIAIEIGGHTDNTGLAEKNLVLSKNRAKAVYEYLTGAGISASRIRFAGYGSTKPILSNETDAGKASNRRTEIKIL